MGTFQIPPNPDRALRHGSPPLATLMVDFARSALKLLDPWHAPARGATLSHRISTHRPARGT
jgi:hypothetical protein